MHHPPLMKLARISFVILLVLPLVLTSHAYALNAVLASCGWDTNTGWVARENAQVGNSNWATGIPPEYSGDYMTSEKGVTPAWGKGTKKSVEGWLDAPSATCGNQIGLHITGNGRPVKIKINRATIPGQYLLRLDDGGPDSAFVPLTIVDPKIKSAITFVSSVLTWQAYNQWGGYSLYKGPNMTRGSRSTIVSFNRPYDGDGSGQVR